LNSAQLLRDDRPRAVVTRSDPLASGVVVDLACVLLTLVSFSFIASDAQTGLRAPLVLVFALFVPGWTILRAFGAPASLLVYAAAVGASFGLLIILGEALVLFGDWKWYPVGLAVTAGICALGAVSTVRRMWAPEFNVWRIPRMGDQVVNSVPLFSVASVVIGNSLVAAGIRRTQRQNFGPMGLVDVMSPVFWVGVSILIAGLVVVCYRGSRWAWLNVAALVAALHGLPGLLEPHPRFSVAWIHAGFTDHIATEGTLLRTLDARFSWAGFFAAGGMLQRWLGTDSMMWLVRYAPLFFNGLSVVLVGLLARRLRATEMQGVVAGALFCCLNWIGQDYFAPQATAFVLYLLIVTVVLYAFPADPSRGNRWLTRVTRPAMDVHQGLQGRNATLVLIGCYALVVAVVISHQLTPGFLLSATLLLAAVNATRVRALPVFIGVAFLAWLSYGASAYWFGHFDALTGSVGKLGDLVNQNVGTRTESQAIGRRIVVASRLGLALFAWGGAALSLFVQWRRRSTPIALACLLVAPFPMVVLQPYGGEMALRVCYFSLPPACILIAQLLLPASRRRLRHWIATGVVVIALVPAFVTARYGNESFEASSNNDVALLRALYDQVPDNSIIFVTSQQTLKYSERVAEVQFRDLPGGTPTEATAKMLRKYPADAHLYVELTDSQEAFGIVALDRPADWIKSLRTSLLATKQYRVVAELGDAVLLELVRP
jgi:uncharacterized membrane protein YhaH (DUF805 family)